MAFDFYRYRRHFTCQCIPHTAGAGRYRSRQTTEGSCVGIVGVDTFYTPFQFPQNQAGINAIAKPFKDDFAQATGQMLRSIFTPDADPARVESLLSYFQGANKQLAMSAFYQVLDWRTKQEKASLAMFDGMLRNINAVPGSKEKPLYIWRHHDPEGRPFYSTDASSRV